MKRVVVTGGAGFIGSHLAEELVQRDYYVIILDDLYTGKMENMEDLLNRSTVEFTKGSVTDQLLLENLFQDVAYVFHQAAIPSVPRSLENPRASHDANVTGTLNVLLAARGSGVKKVIYASSSSVYGDTPELPKKEDMAPNPRSPYAVTKLAAEYYCQVFREVFGLSTVSLRYFNVYGPRQDPNSQYAAVIPKFINWVLLNSRPTIFGDGDQTRDFTFVKDAVQASILAAETNADGVFNVGSGRNITINGLARMVLDFTGIGLEPIHQEPRPGDIWHSLADISKAKTFGYEPRYSLEEGLAETIRSFRHAI
ncbi:unnamed protein product [marine sediment metagenome]|uniref:NAD-dependent epimerase/dehydratase domain-containing protein n=1 Tax=marine sediment metagenome TaxID=412755 RepID=X0TS36_9ZZZZ